MKHILFATALMFALPVQAAGVADIAKTYADIAEAGYEDSLITARKLQEAITALVASPSEATLAAAPLHRAGILHLAAHGDVDDREVRRSFVLLGQPEGDDDGDGLLQWSEAAALDLGASLVTLASCRSARGVLAVGEGVTGLTQAFLFAGATCVLAAQTDVSDAFTRAFMLDFYRHLRDGETAAGALREAQLAAAESPNARTRWADFVLGGDGSVTLAAADAPRDLRRPLAAVAALVVAITATVALRRR